MDLSDSFVDHYAVLQCSPEAPLAELRHAYSSRLRELHSGCTRPHLQQHAARELYDAWMLLKDPDKRKTYNVAWRKNRWVAMSPHDKAELRYRQGCKLLLKAMNITAQAEAVRPASGPSAVSQYRSAMDRFSQGIDVAPNSYKLRIARATCFAKLHDWPNCREDALCANVLEPDAAESLALLARALWQEGWHLEARRQLSAGLVRWPENLALLSLQDEFRDGPRVIQHGGVFTLKLSVPLTKPNIAKLDLPHDGSPERSPARSEKSIPEELTPALSKVLAKVLLPSQVAGTWSKNSLKSYTKALAKADPPTAATSGHRSPLQPKRPQLPAAGKQNVSPWMPTLLAAKTPQRAADGWTSSKDAPKVCEQAS